MAVSDAPLRATKFGLVPDRERHHEGFLVLAGECLLMVEATARAGPRT